MIQRYITLTFAFLSIIISTGQKCEQSDIVFDYESHPYQPYNFTHLDLDLTLEPDQDLVSGIATYQVSAKVDGLTELLLHTEKSAIESVLIDEDVVQYSVSGDSLLIELPDSTISDEVFDLQITWQSTSDFGLLKDYKGNFWSSKNPLAHHHWFPVFDHPRVELMINATFTIPLEREILFNGDIVQSTPISKTRKKVYYETETPVPVTGLGFAMGDFVISEITSGFTKLRLFSPEFGFYQEQREALVIEAGRIKKDIEKELSFEYPWQGLNIVVLPDNTWEERTHGAGTIFLYENLGSLENQLKRGMYAQWFGEYLRTEQFFHFDEGSNQLLSTALHYEISDSAALIENPDSLFKIEEWNNWQLGFENESSTFKTTVIESLKEFVRSMKGVVNFDEYAENWYAKTGIPRFNPQPMVLSNTVEEEASSPKYKVSADYDDANSLLTLHFTLIEGEGEELYSLTLVDHQFDATETHEVIFTGVEDEVSIKLSLVTEYITFVNDSYSTEDLTYGLFPLNFLLNQLRSEDKEDRILAARLLKAHTENPDLQLALSDVLAFEEDSNVIAAINETMAEFTAGAFGTEEKFLNDLRSDSKDVKLASIKALANYPDNETVQSAIRSEVLRSTDSRIFETALEVYQQMVGGEELLSVATRLQRSDSTGAKAMYVLDSSDSLHVMEASIPLAEKYLQKSYSFSIRKQAFNYLKQFDFDPERWAERLNILTTDRDPRMRFLGYESVLSFKTTTEALVYMRSSGLDESDPRVLLLIDGIISELAE